MKLFSNRHDGHRKILLVKKLSKKLKTGGYDLDFLIESHEEKSIAEIFAEEGEEYFRKTEAKVLRWFGEKKTFVLATGGGTPCFSNNMEWMNSQGITIWIDEPVEVLAGRLKPGKEHRPLIKDLSDDQLQQFLINKLAERNSFYQQSTYHLQGDAISDAGFARIIKQHA
jgi:shikimate kinase